MSFRLEKARARLLGHLEKCGKIHRDAEAYASPETWASAEKALEEAAARVAELQPKPKE